MCFVWLQFISYFRELCNLNNFFQPKPTPRHFWLVDAPRKASAARAPTIRVVIFEILKQTHSRKSLSLAIERVVTTIVQPFYDTAKLPAMHKKHIVKKARQIYTEYQQLTVARAAKPEKRSKSFESRCKSFEDKLDDTLFVPPGGTVENLKEDDRQMHEMLKVCLFFSLTCFCLIFTATANS